ncbi:MAG TPA: CPBP family intramembrane glutamic endopeptidase [Polyangiales bacterium]|nr:CPBP family intramembrane glutamic endopeptidase [Polyangiales bacterium]
MTQSHAQEAVVQDGETQDAPPEARPAFGMGDVVPGVLGPHARLGLLGSLIVGWFLLIQRFGEGDIYAVQGPYACLVVVVSWSLYPEALKHWLKATWKAIWVGVAVGIGMTALTYGVFQVAVKIAPSLDGQVQALYTGARSTTLPKALAWVVALVLAEELLFRGAWPATLRNFMSARAAFSVSLVTYALAQLGTGSWIVMALALGCGTLWTLQRYYTGSLLSPLIAHLIWTPTVILLYPVT